MIGPSGGGGETVSQSVEGEQEDSGGVLLESQQPSSPIDQQPPEQETSPEQPIDEEQNEQQQQSLEQNEQIESTEQIETTEQFEQYEPVEPTPDEQVQEPSEEVDFFAERED